MIYLHREMISGFASLENLPPAAAVDAWCTVPLAPAHPRASNPVSWVPSLKLALSFLSLSLCLQPCVCPL